LLTVIPGRGCNAPGPTRGHACEWANIFADGQTRLYITPHEMAVADRIAAFNRSSGAGESHEALAGIKIPKHTNPTV
jgi:hypothetical protein